MELLLIRHALPVRTVGVDGPADPVLADAGVAQSERLAEYLANESITAIYASPLRRAVQTAAPVAADHGIDVVVSEGLAEWDRNAAEYVPVEELRANNDPRWTSMVAGEWISDEDPGEFEARVVGAIEAIIATHPGELVAAVCHGGVINSYLAHVLGRPGGAAFFAPNYTSIHRVAAAATGQRSVMTINETAHLRGTGLPVGLFDRG